MTRELQRATFNRSALVRVLSDTTPEVSDPKYDFGERLGQWLDFSDALALFSVLNSSTGTSPAALEKPNASARNLQDQLARVRHILSESILNDGVFSPETAKIRFPTPLPNASAEQAAEFSPYHRYYLAHQRDMSSAISALRSNARKALAPLSPARKQLAELDLSFEKFLAGRERNLLANIPILLAKRFALRYEEHRTSLADGSSDDPATWATPGSWLEAFCRDAQAVLIAELELRLKPVAGLIAALGSPGETNETTPQ
ncbi:MAG: hypothetical protein H6R13_811 [Proteobacteria bacterium]|nr:hypothetical protein [Pseudomonadota bacterium]